MAKKSKDFYFNNFIECADCAWRAAKMLESILENYTPGKLDEAISKIHEIEHEGDQKRHELVEALAKSFITPIEREDIMELSRNIDDVTDAVEDIALRIYMCNVKTIRSEAIEMAKMAINACSVLKELMTEFENFKKSKELKRLVIEINKLESDGDLLYMKSIRDLHTTEKDPIALIAWRDIYNYMEKCLDACEHAADSIETVMMNNT